MHPLLFFFWQVTLSLLSKSNLECSKLNRWIQLWREVGSIGSLFKCAYYYKCNLLSLSTLCWMQKHLLHSLFWDKIPRSFNFNFHFFFLWYTHIHSFNKYLTQFHMIYLHFHKRWRIERSHLILSYASVTHSQFTWHFCHGPLANLSASHTPNDLKVWTFVQWHISPCLKHGGLV